VALATARGCRSTKRLMTARRSGFASFMTHQVVEGTLLRVLRAFVASSRPSLQRAWKLSATSGTGGTREGQGHCLPACM